MDKDKELARLRALDTEQKARVLGKLQNSIDLAREAVIAWRR